MVKFFAKGPQGVSLGSDASIFKDLSVYPPEKVTISMLITAQVFILGDNDVDDYKMVTIFWCRRQNFDVGDIFLILVPGAYVKR